MNAMLATLCAMLKSSRPEQPVAAAIVLAEMRPKEPGVVKALAGALAEGSRPLRLAALDALGQIASPHAVPAVLPLLEAADDEIREKATRVLTQIGPAAVKPIARQILDAPPPARRSLIMVLSRVKTPDSVQALLSLLESGHPEAPREAAQALGALSHAMGRAERTRLRTQLEKLLRTPPDRAPAGALSAALFVIGSVGQPGTAATLLRLIGPRYGEPIRRDALLAIAGVVRGGALSPGLLGGILPLIQDGPSPALRSAALEVLSAVQLPVASLDALLKLLDNPDPAVRRFAARKLGDKGLGGPRTVKRLIKVLAGADPALRDAASETLGGLPEAAAPLAEELLACQEIHRSWTIAHILKKHVSRLRRPVVRKIFDHAVTALTAEDRIWEPRLYLVRQHDPKAIYEWLMETSARLKKARKYAEAEACLKPLTRGDHFDSEARYALALAGIKAARSRGAASSQAASCMDLFRQLVRDPAFPLVDRLKKERTHLETEDLYYLGFHLSEGTADEREAGAELLKTVAARAGASKLGRSAKSKLRSEGLGL